MKKILLSSALCLLPLAITSCGLEEVCENEAQQVRITSSTGSAFLIDKFEASRTNATAQTAGTGVTMACNLQNTIPWGNVTYEDAQNACLDAGKRLCTKDEWMAACGSNYYPYGQKFDNTACASSGVESSPTGSKSKCKSNANVFDMSGNLREWVEEGILMGGAYSSGQEELRCTAAIKPQGDALLYSPSAADGFRCCQDIALQ